MERPETIAQAVEQAQERFDSIDVLINNAGHGYRAALEEGEPAAVAELFQTNFFGPVELIKLVLPAMREQKLRRYCKRVLHRRGDAPAWAAATMGPPKRRWRR